LVSKARGRSKFYLPFSPVLHQNETTVTGIKNKIFIKINSLYCTVQSKSFLPLADVGDNLNYKIPKFAKAMSQID
jgi:hypothetical protein